MSMSLMLGTSLVSVATSGGGSVPPTILTAPTDLAFTPPFNVWKTQAGLYGHDFDPLSRKPSITTATYYVGAGGSDSADGLSWANRFATISKALTVINALTNTAAQVYHLRIQIGRYVNASGFNRISCNRRFVIEPVDASGNLIPVSDGRFSTANQIISILHQAMPAFVATSDPTVWTSTYTTETPAPGLWDEAFLNRFGRPLGAIHVPTAAIASVSNPIAELQAMHTKFGKGAFHLDTTNKKLWVRLSDGRQPDASVFVAQTGAAHFNLAGPFGAEAESWMRNVDFWGRGIGTFSNATTASGQRQKTTISDCYIGYQGTSNNALGIIHQGSAYNYRCVVTDTFVDGFGYSLDTSDTTVTYGLTFVELDSIAEYIGSNAISDTSTNASTSHRGCTGVRVNDEYGFVSNRIVHDIETSKTWNVGLKIGPSTRTSVAAAGFVSGVTINSDTQRAATGIAAGFQINTGETAKVWVEGAVFTDPLTYKVAAYRGATLYAKDAMPTPNETDGGTGTLTVY